MWVDYIDSPIQPFRDLTEQGTGSSICWCFRLLRSRTGGHQIRQPYSCLRTWMERLCRWPYYCRTESENVGRTSWSNCRHIIIPRGDWRFFRRQFENAHRRPGSVMKEKTSSPASLPGGGTPPHKDDLGDRGQCFSCGFFGHGVNRCPRLDRSFPYKMLGWSVDVRDGQYRASRMCRDKQDLRLGKEGWFGREGQPPGPSVTVTRLTWVGVIIRLGND